MNAARMADGVRRSAVAAAMIFCATVSSRGDLINANRKFTPGGGAAGDNFGQSISMLDDHVIAGAGSHAGGLRGAAYVYAIAGTSIVQQAELAASGGQAGDDFGHAVSITAGRAIVGADQARRTAARPISSRNRERTGSSRRFSRRQPQSRAINSARRLR